MVFDGSGTVIQTISFELESEAWQQKSISVPVDDGFVRWNIEGESDAHFFYAVQVDNESNDGTLFGLSSVNRGIRERHSPFRGFELAPWGAPGATLPGQKFSSVYSFRLLHWDETLVDFSR